MRENPDIDQLKRQARELLEAYRRLEARRVIAARSRSAAHVHDCRPGDHHANSTVLSSAVVRALPAGAVEPVFVAPRGSIHAFLSTQSGELRSNTGMMLGENDPDAIIAEMPSRKAAVTAEKIAINAVMAGCRPEYFPVILAGIEGLVPPEKSDDF